MLRDAPIDKTLRSFKEKEDMMLFACTVFARLATCGNGSGPVYVFETTFHVALGLEAGYVATPRDEAVQDMS